MDIIFERAVQPVAVGSGKIFYSFINAHRKNINEKTPLLVVDTGNIWFLITNFL